jgi:hypothetical protein
LGRLNLSRSRRRKIPSIGKSHGAACAPPQFSTAVPPLWPVTRSNRCPSPSLAAVRARSSAPSTAPCRSASDPEQAETIWLHEGSHRAPSARTSRSGARAYAAEAERLRRSKSPSCP